MTHTPSLLVINPNTSPDITAAVDGLAQAVLGNRAAVDSRTASFGFNYIDSRVAASIAAHAVLDTAAQAMIEGLQPDAIVLACFGDPGREALAEMTGLPVIGFAEAGLLAAAALPGRYLIATRGQVWCNLLMEIIVNLGIEDQLAGIISIDIANDAPNAIADSLDRAAQAHGASRIVLGGAGLIPVMAQVGAACRTPILDPHREAFLKALQQARLFQPGDAIAPYADAQITGLSRSLSALLTGPRAIAMGRRLEDGHKS